MRATFGHIMTYNLTSQYNYGTSIFIVAEQRVGEDIINYNMIEKNGVNISNSYNWTEAAMVFFPKGVRPRRVDYRYSVEKHGGFFPAGNNSEMEGGYTYYDYIESYNRLYHYPELQMWYVYKTGLALDDDGIPMNVNDPRTGKQVPKFSYLNNSKP